MSLGARFVLLGLVAIVLMVVDHRQDQLHRVRRLLNLAVYPINLVVDLPFSVWGAMTDSLTDRTTLMRENERLHNELLLARYKLQTLESLENENAKLRELLNTYGVERDQDVRIAEILSVDLENRQRFTINRGLADNVYVGQPLLDADGVVGQIRNVYELTSEAMMITDTDFAVYVTVRRDGRDGFRTLAEGTGDSGMLRLPYVTNSEDIAAGDELVTSGLGGTFPRGRPVAVVNEVNPQPGQQFAEVIAKPVSALDRAQEVLLIWNNEAGTGEAESAAVAESRP